MATNHYFDSDGFFTFSAPANIGSQPPSSATRQSPPRCGKHEWPRWISDDWYCWISYKGEVYWEMDGSKHVVNNHAPELPPNVLLTPPPDESFTNHDGVQWLRDDSVILKRNIAEALREIRHYLRQPLQFLGFSWATDSQSISEMLSIIKNNPIESVAWPVNNYSDIRMTMTDEFRAIIEAHDKRIVDAYAQFTEWNLSGNRLTIKFEITHRE